MNILSKLNQMVVGHFDTPFPVCDSKSHILLGDLSNATATFEMSPPFVRTEIHHR